MTTRLAALLALFLGTLTASASWSARMSLEGKISIRDGNQVLMDIVPLIIRPVWKAQNFLLQSEPRQGRDVYCGANGKATGKNSRVNLRMSVSQTRPNALQVSCTFVPERDVLLHSLNISTTLATDFCAGCEFATHEGFRAVLPKQLGENVHIYRKPTSDLTIKSKRGDIKFILEAKNTLLLQDERTWNNDWFLVRYSVPASTDGLVGENQYLYKAKTQYHATLTIVFPQNIVFQDVKPVVMRQDETWIPLQNKLDIVAGSALDFTTVMGHDAPAGKHGWTKAVGQDFEFENLPGTKQRFYGVNLCMGAYNLTHEQCDILADRLARFGYNAIRIHHHENFLAGGNKRSSLLLDKKRLDQIFYLFAALKKRGIYVTTDVYVSRQVTAGEIYPGEQGHLRPNEFAQLCAVSPQARENWKSFAREFLGTVNPYTGLTLAEDPALNVISMVNEGTLTGAAFASRFPRRFQRAWLAAWNRWIAEVAPTASQRKALGIGRYPETSLPNLVGFGTPRGRAFAHFLHDTHQQMYREMTSFMRKELKSKALFTDMNYIGQNIWAQATRSTFDYVDHHFYVDHPVFLGETWKLPSTCPNDSVIRTGNLGGGVACFVRNLDKPFTITEWNYCGPGKYRGIGGIITGCLGAIQNWGGLWRFAYSHSNDMFRPDRRAAGYFDVVADPFAQITERATLCLFLRQDLKPAEHTIALTIDQDWCRNPAAPEIRSLTVPWSGFNLLAKTGTMVAPAKSKVKADISLPLTKDAPQGTHHLDGYSLHHPNTPQKIGTLIHDLKWLPEHNPTQISQTIYQTPNGQFTVRAPDNSMILNTPLTAGGFAERGRSIVTEWATFTLGEADGTVWISSLTKQPINTSSRLLISHVTELHNTGQTYAEEAKTTLLAWGRQPFLVKKGSVKITLNLQNPEQLEAYRLDLAGNRIDRLPTRMVDGKLILELQINHQGKAQLLYELVRKNSLNH